MASINNVYILAGAPYKVYEKAVPSKVSGYRLDPQSEPKRAVAFVLESNESVLDADRIELYSEQEDMYFTRTNAALFDRGLLKPVDVADVETERDTHSVNVLSDSEVLNIASTKSMPTLKKTIDPITSVATLQRIKRAAEEIGMRKDLLSYVQRRVDEMSQE